MKWKSSSIQFFFLFPFFRWKKKIIDPSIWVIINPLIVFDWYLLFRNRYHHLHSVWSLTISDKKRKNHYGEASVDLISMKYKNSAVFAVGIHWSNPFWQPKWVHFASWKLVTDPPGQTNREIDKSDITLHVNIMNDQKVKMNGY